MKCLFRSILLASVMLGAPLVSAHVGNFIAVEEPGFDVFVVEQAVEGVSPEMLDWWWDNINTSERYRLLHPTENYGFEWLVVPENPNHLPYSPGAVQLVSQTIAGQLLQTKLTWMPAEAHEDCESADKTLLAKLEFPDYEGILPAGTLRYDYNRNQTGDALLVRVKYSLPVELKILLPEYVNGLPLHVVQELQNLPSFLPDLFQEEFIEGELLTRGSYQITQTGWLLKKVVVDQEIKNLTPDMVNWWWDNINTTSRYKRWHPTAHVSFEWLEPPHQPNSLKYSVGAVQLVSEYIGPYKSNLLITWLDPEDIADQVEYDHWVYAKTDLKELRGILPQKMFHQYRLNDEGDGILMRSTFTVPAFFDFIMPKFTQRLAEHAQQEMQFLSYFLPGFYAREYMPSKP